jgi:hypothetical protein
MIMIKFNPLSESGNLRPLAGGLLAIALVCGLTGITPVTAQGTKSVKAREAVVATGEESKAALEDSLTQWGKILDGYNSIMDGSAKNTEKTYKTLLSDLKAAEGKGANTTKSLTKMDKQAQSFFKDWEKELDQFSNESMKEKSTAMMDKDKAGYADFKDRMTQAGEVFAPVLQELNDQVLFLGRNLSPDGIEMLQDEATKMNEMVKEATAQVEALLAGAANVPAEEPADMPHPAAAEDAADGGADAEAEDQPAEGDESS